MVLAVFFSAAFFLCANYLNFSGVHRFNSPDETAAYAFAGAVAADFLPVIHQTEDFGEWERFVFPRSAFADTDGRIVPAGFWGWFFALGILAKIFGLWPIVLVTPALTLVAAFAFRSLIKKIFSEKIADLSWFLFLFHPAVLYYAARGLFVNLAVLDLAIISAWFFFSNNFSAKWRFLSAWFFLGLAVFIRPSEIWWIAILMAVFYVFFRKHADRWFYLTVAPVGFFYFFSYWLLNKNLFGSGLSTAYQVTGSLSGEGIISWVLPFGFHPTNFLRAGFDYLVVLPWAFSVPAIAGALFCLKKERTRVFYAYFVAVILVSVFLTVFYGSYAEPRQNWLTLGIAFSRYWLPIFVFSVPFAAVAASWLTGFFSKRASDILIFFAVGFWLIQSVTMVFAGPDGLIATKQNIDYGKSVRETVVSLVGDGAMIMTETEDKFFWPDLPVMKNVFNPDILNAARGFLRQNREVYFFTSFLPRLSQEKTAEKFLSAGLEISPIEYFFHHTLYSVSLEKK